MFRYLHPTPNIRGLTAVMYRDISLSDVYCHRIYPKYFRIPTGIGLLPCEKVWVRIIDQHSWPTPATFSMTPDYLALDYLAQHIRTLCIYLSCRTPTPTPLLPTTLPS
jgi:hypothetical protein